MVARKGKKFPRIFFLEKNAPEKCPDFSGESFLGAICFLKRPAGGLGSDEGRCGAFGLD
jgi:hypothetical protein